MFPNSNLPNLSTKTEEFIINIENSIPKPLFEMSVNEARNYLLNLQNKPKETIEADIFDTHIFYKENKNIELRIVKPKNVKEKLPLVFYIHGGGWVLGSKESYDELIRKLAIELNATIIFPSYSLSPEAKYPDAINELFFAFKHICKNPEEFNIDEKKVVLMGDSAGGNMAIVLAMKAKTMNLPNIKFLCLLYPVTNADMDTKSYVDFADGPWLSKKAMDWFWDNYVPDKSNRDDFYISPLKSDIEDLENLPTTLLISVENDVLRDEGESFARKLDIAGVDVINIRVNGTIHDFLMLNALKNTPQTKYTISMIKGVFNDILS